MVTALSTIINALAILISAASPIILAMIYRKQGAMLANSEIAKEASVRAAEKAETVRINLADASHITDEKLEHIKVSVNSERTAMIERIEALHAEVLKLRVTPGEDRHGVPAAVQNIKAPEEESKT